MATVTRSASRRVRDARLALAANNPAIFGENNSAALVSPDQTRVDAARRSMQMSPAPKQPDFSAAAGNPAAKATKGGSLEKIAQLEKEIAELQAKLSRTVGATIHTHQDIALYTGIIKRLQKIERLKKGAGRTRRRKNMSRKR
ncbi:MAG: hypothetical protein EBY32_07480 [Proteobacteria bacterium]|nr:hypothetical protein [Pseudomonadota bacterium]